MARRQNPTMKMRSQVAGSFENLFPTARHSPRQTRCSRRVVDNRASCFLQNSPWPQVTSMKSRNTDSATPKNCFKRMSFLLTRNKSIMLLRLLQHDSNARFPPLSSFELLFWEHTLCLGRSDPLDYITLLTRTESTTAFWKEGSFWGEKPLQQL